MTKPECLALLRSAPGSPLGQELSQAIRDALREHERCWGLLARQPELENHPLLRDGAARRNILDGPGAFRRIKNAVPRSLVRELEPRTDYVNNWIAEKVGEIVRDPERSHLPLPSIEQMRRLLLIEAQKVRLSPAALKVIGVDDPLQPMRDELLAALRVSRQAFHKRLAALGVNDFRRPL